jgi:hypothetical protein
VADEYLVGDFHTLADEGVRRNLAASADGDVLLDFDEGSDLGFVADGSAVKIDQRGLENLHLVADFDVLADGHGCLPLRKARATSSLRSQRAGWLIVKCRQISHD